MAAWCLIIHRSMWWNTPKKPKPFYKRFKFIAIMTVLGLLVIAGLAAEVFWLHLKSEYEAKATQFDLAKLEEMESASVIFDRNNNVLGKIFIQNREPLTLDDFPEQLKQAVVAAEDSRFWQHHGVDYYGIARAALKNYRAHHTVQGASTLTQQLARNSYPQQLPAKDRTYQRKILEVFVAERIERHFDKNKILEMYLNRVYFGSGFYGAETAARGYFGKSARNLNLSECATLAGLLKNPGGLSPWSNRKACIESRNYVLSRMLELGMIAKATYDETLSQDLLVKNKKTKRAESYALDYIRQQVESEVGVDSASSDGYRIYTTIDGDLQRKAQESLQRHLSEVEKRPDFKHQTYAQYSALFKQRAKKGGDNDSDNNPSALPAPEYLQGALVAVDNSDGGIVALVGGRDFDQSQFDRALQSRRPAGTAFKPLVFAAAFEKGIFPGALFLDSVMDNRLVMIGGTQGILGEWGPERIDNKFEGYIPARYALVKSKNAATVRLGMATGIDRVTALAKNAGIDSPLRPYPATYLGSSDVTLLEMTMAYTTFPNLGWKPAKPFIIKRIEEKDGRVVFQEKQGFKEVVKPTTAYEVHSCLSEVLEWGTGDKAFSKYGLKKFPVAGETGTAYGFTDVMFVGYSSGITCGVWAGFDKPREPIYRGAFSSDIVLPVWVDVMNASFANYNPREIEMPRGLSKYKICTTSGLLATDKCVETLTDKTTGQTVERPTSYYEIGTLDQVPKEACVHGESGPKNTPQAVANNQQPAVPRAVLAVDVTAVNPVAIKSAPVLGEEDPYNSIKPRAPAGAAQTPDNSQAAPIDNTDTGGQTKPADDVEVRRAEPVRPLDEPAPDTTIKVEPPPALDF